MDTLMRMAELQACKKENRKLKKENADLREVMGMFFTDESE
jgi:hypothetical protein